MPSPHDRPVKPGDYVYLIDGSGFIFRAYHALPPLNRRSDGLPLNAVLGFCNMLNKLLREIDAGERPSHIAVVFDKPARSFRSAIYKDYKAHRPEPPSDLVPQFGIIRQAVKAFAVPAIEQEGFEADDLIATYARLARAAGAKVRIVSSDRCSSWLTSRATIWPCVCRTWSRYSLRWRASMQPLCTNFLDSARFCTVA